jgi:tryptophanyl-tRNA synthetase
MSNTPIKRKVRVFSGVQPSGELHLGNYLGAIRRWVPEQDAKENFFCVVDMHAITVPQDPQELHRKTRELAALYIASGLDPQKSTIFVQSQVKAHAELCWILNCVTPLGWLERMTQYKSKAEQQESVLTGLLDYPVLMAADILLYDADEVPVGEDQKQHVELTRDIAQRFNRIFGETFVVPEPEIAQTGARIMGFDDPTHKMSKSQAHIPGHAVRLTDSPDDIRRTLKRAVTDTGREIVFSDAPEKAGVNNMLEIYQLLTGQTRTEVEAHFATSKGYGALKGEVAEVIIEALRPVRERYQQLISDAAELDRILDDGAQRANAVAGPKVDEVKRRVGFIVR